MRDQHVAVLICDMTIVGHGLGIALPVRTVADLNDSTAIIFF